jgi:hypothetical protein
MVDWNVNSLVHCCAPAAGGAKWGNSRRTHLHWTSLATAPQRGRSENNVRSPGDGPKAAYYPPSDRVKITYGDSLVTGDVRTLTLATAMAVPLECVDITQVNLTGDEQLVSLQSGSSPNEEYGHSKSHPNLVTGHFKEWMELCFVVGYGTLLNDDEDLEWRYWLILVGFNGLRRCKLGSTYFAASEFHIFSRVLNDCSKTLD